MSVVGETIYPVATRNTTTKTKVKTMPISKIRGFRESPSIVQASVARPINLKIAFSKLQSEAESQIGPNLK